jgi:transposase
MAKRKFSLTLAEVAQISRVLESTTGDPAYDRLRAILDYSAGVKWKEIVARFHCSRSSLQHWCSTYRTFGEQALIGRGRPGGRESRLTRFQLADLEQRLASTSPAQAFQETEPAGGSQWTAKDLYRAIQLWYGVVYDSPTTYYTLLKRLKPMVSPGLEYK